MKKGLLSLLALALTVVGCQNYDDQFAELTDLITDVQTQVAGLSDLEDRIAAIDTRINGLATLAQLQSATAGLATTSDVDGLGDAIDALELEIDEILADLEALSGSAATQQQITDLNNRLDSVDSDLDELLAANATINQSITINSLATLQYAESLISTGEGDPNVIVNGNVTVDVNQAFASHDSVNIGRINAVTNKFATILGKETGGLVHVSYTASPSIGALEMNSLVFVDTDLDVSGSTETEFGALANVTGSASMTFAGDIAFTTPLSITGDLVIGTGATGFNFNNCSANSVSTAGSAAGVLVLNDAGVINTGDAEVTSITAGDATDITVGADGTYASLTVVASSDLEELTVNAEDITGALSVTGQDSTTTINFAALETVGGVVNIAAGSNVDLGELTTINNNATLGGNTIDLDNLATVTGTLVISHEVTVALPKFAPTAQTTLTLAETASLKSASSTLLNGPELEDLTLAAQPSGAAGNFIANASTFPSLTDLDITGVEDEDDPTAQANDLTVGGAVIEDVTVNGWFNSVTVDGASSLTDLTVNGENNALTINDNDDLVNLTLAHDHIEGADAHYLTISDNADLANVTTTELEEVGDVLIYDNAKLATINLSSVDGTSPVAGTFTVSISNNNLVGDYLAAVAQTTTTLLKQTIIKSDDILTIKNFVADKAAAVTYNVTVDIDVVNYDDRLGTAVSTKTLADAIATEIASSTFAGGDNYINQGDELNTVVAED